MKTNSYPDGTTYVTNTLLGVKTFRINDYNDLWLLKQYVDAFHDKYDKPHVRIIPNVLIPNLIDEKADRRFNKGESFGLKLVLQELLSLNANFQIFHPHNPEVVEMAFEIMNKKVDIVDNTDFIRNVLYGDTFIGKDFNNLDNLVLMSADAGGFKPLMKLCDKLDWRGDVGSASKSRKYVDGKTSLSQIVGTQDFEGKDILIIDDSCVYGGTFKGLASILKERNCGKIYLAVSHMTIQNLGDDPVTNYFDKVFTTNSKFDTYFVWDKTGAGGEPENLEIIKLF